MAKKVAFIILVAAALATYFWQDFTEFRLNAKMSEVRALVGGVTSAQSIHFEKWKRYSSDFENLGYSPSADLNTAIYLKPEDLPGDIRALLKPENMPSVREKSYDVIVTFMKIDDSDFRIWTLNEKEELNQIYPSQ